MKLIYLKIIIRLLVAINDMMILDTNKKQGVKYMIRTKDFFIGTLLIAFVLITIMHSLSAISNANLKANIIKIVATK